MTEPKTDAELLKIYDDTWNRDEFDESPIPEIERVCLRAVYDAGRADAEPELRGSILSLLSEFTTYEPGDGTLHWSITDHMFLDFDFWPRLTALLDPAPSRSTQPEGAPQ